MLKVNYPTDLGRLHQDYISLLHSHFNTREFKAFKKTKLFLRFGMSLEEILTSNFDTLVNSLPELLTCTDFAKSRMGHFFDYKALQPKIANFFMKYADILNLSTCFYCNIDYINSFRDFADFYDAIDFVNRATREELQKIKYVTDNQASKIILERAKKRITSIDSLALSPVATSNLKNMVTSSKNHFTLDHLMGKAEFPLFSLSLHNLIPCCYSCNTKFKKDTNLFDQTGINFLGPSSSTHAFDQSVRFKLVFKHGGYKQTTCKEEFALYFDILSNHIEYKKFINLLKLDARYAFHKREAMTLIEKAKKYPDAHLRMLSGITGIPEDKIKKDIFGADLFQGAPHEKPFTKLRRDIAKEIGIGGVL